MGKSAKWKVSYWVKRHVVLKAAQVMGHLESGCEPLQVAQFVRHFCALYKSPK